MSQIDNIKNLKKKRKKLEMEFLHLIILQVEKM